MYTTIDPWTALRKLYFSSKETQKYYVIGYKGAYVIPSSKDTSVQHTVVFKLQGALVEEV